MGSNLAPLVLLMMPVNEEDEWPRLWPWPVLPEAPVDAVVAELDELWLTKTNEQYSL